MSITTNQKSILAFEDGTVYHGYAIGITGTTGGELCFNTSMAGYQEIITDPSYFGQIVLMTYPHIGNYGVSSRDDEHGFATVSGLIVKAFSFEFSNPNADSSLQEYLEKNQIVGISGVDTRKIVRYIREKGVMNVVISSEITDEQELINRAKNWVSIKGLDLAKEVTRKEAQTIKAENQICKVAAFDYGIKQNIINHLTEKGCTLRIFPAKTSWDEVEAWNPDGFFFSNGPGDPNPMDYAIETINHAKKTSKPLFGICLGHQLMALSEGFEVEKMHTGHHGANHPVKNLETGLVEISTQNHGFSVKTSSVDTSKASVTHINLNDQTVEGLRFKNFNGFSIQYHPEASPGPNDSNYLIDQFVNLIQANIHK